MVEVFSKQDGPRREDAHIRQVLAQNKGIITKLADQLSNGRYSRSKIPRQAPQPDRDRDRGALCRLRASSSTSGAALLRNLIWSLASG